jgi:hypothetical protein
MQQILTSNATFFAARFDRKAYSWERTTQSRKKTSLESSCPGYVYKEQRKCTCGSPLKDRQDFYSVHEPSLHLHHAPFSLWIVMAIMRMIGHHLRAASPWLTLVDTNIKATRAKRVVHGRIPVSRCELTISHFVACIHCIRCKFSLRERLAPRYRGSKQRP